MIERSTREGVDWLRMTHGRANALDLEFLRALRAEFERDCKALVLTGSGSIFSAGVDLRRLLDSEAQYVDEFLIELDACFRCLFEAPFPVIACVNGHAIAGGAILALASDERIAIRGAGRFGIPELLVGVPFPAMALEVVRYAAPRATWTRLVLRGETPKLEEAAALGLVDELVDPSELEARAQSRAAALAGMPRASFAATKAGLRRPAMQNYRAGFAHEDELKTIWRSEDCRSAIRAYVERVLGKG